LIFFAAMAAIHCAVMVLQLLLSGAPSLIDCQTRDDLQKQFGVLTEDVYTQDGLRSQVIKRVSRPAESIVPGHSAVYRRNTAGKGPGNFVRIGRGDIESLRQDTDAVDRLLSLTGQQQQENHQQLIDPEQTPEVSIPALRQCLQPLSDGNDASACLLQAMTQLANRTPTKRNGSSPGGANSASPGGKFVRIGRSYLMSDVNSKRERNGRENRFVRIGKNYD
jgi:hypothetical protein